MSEYINNVKQQRKQQNIIRVYLLIALLFIIGIIVFHERWLQTEASSQMFSHHISGWFV